MELKTNAGEVAKILEQNSKDLVKAIQKTLQKWGNATIRYGKKNKKYQRRSGNLDRAQKAKVSGLDLLITIDASQVTNNGFNYGLIQHDGSKDPARPHPVKIGKKWVTVSKGVKGDPWLENAVDDKKDELEKLILEDIDRILG